MGCFYCCLLYTSATGVAFVVSWILGIPEDAAQPAAQTAPETPAAPAEAPAVPAAAQAAEIGLAAPLTGEAVPMEETKDPAFMSGALGTGVAKMCIRDRA